MISTSESARKAKPKCKILAIKFCEKILNENKNEEKAINDQIFKISLNNKIVKNINKS